MRIKRIELIILFGAIAWNLLATDLPFKLPDIGGWYKTLKTEVYYPNSLWNYIDGAADMYLEYDFVDLHLAEYRMNEKYFIVEFYHHNNANCAFGIYSQERPVNIEILNIGAEGYQDGAVLNFLVDDYYIKLSTSSNDKLVENTMIEAARKIAQAINISAKFPRLLKCFPQQDKILNSEKYIHKNFLGFEFLKYAFSVKYAAGDDNYELFIIENKDPEENEKMLKFYLEFAKQSSENIDEGYYIIKDKYNGDVGLYWTGTFIWGVINEKSEIKRKELVDILHANLLENNFIIYP